MKVEIRTKTLAEEVLKLIKLDRQITETTTNDEKSKSIVGLDLINKVIFDSRSALFNMTSPMSSSSLTRPRNDNDELNNNNNNNEDDDDDDDDDRSSSFSNKRLKTASSSSSSAAAAAVVASTTTTANNFVVRKLEYTKDSTKTNDELHQSIDICPVMNALMQTEVFQRLENIKQLGNAQFIYRGANHNRLQHSLGVAYLAEKIVSNIKDEQPAFKVSPKDVLCVKLAGLFHDIGHGPMSHLYEAFRGSYLPKYLATHPQLQKEYNDCEYQHVPAKWSHEDSSLLFIDALLDEVGLQINYNNSNNDDDDDDDTTTNNLLDQPLRQIGNGIDAASIRAFKPLRISSLSLSSSSKEQQEEDEDRILTSRDFIFIKECILGSPLDGNDDFIGRQDKTLEWLYDIVNNRHNGMDVDKIDYFARDYTRAIEKVGIKLKMITDARIAKAMCSRPEKCHSCKKNNKPGMHYMICYPEKRIPACAEFFKERFHLHNIVYQHKTTTTVEAVICDIFCLADPFFRMNSYSGEKFPISRACYKSDFLVRLDDSVLTLIDQSTDKRLKEARELLRRFKRRDLYKCAVDHSLDVDRPDVDDIEDLEGDELVKAEESIRDKHIWNMTEKEIESGMLKEIQIWGNEQQNKNDDDSDNSVTSLQAHDFIVKKFCMHHGAGSKNPLQRMRFYDEMNENKLCGPIEDIPFAHCIQESKHGASLPRSFQKIGIRVIVRNDNRRGVVNQLFYQWFERETDRIKIGDNAMPPQCGVGYAPLNNSNRNRNDNENDNNINDGIEFLDDNDDHNDDPQEQRNLPPVFLSQDSDDDIDIEGGDYNDDNFGQQQDMSPVPVSRGMRNR